VNIIEDIAQTGGIAAGLVVPPNVLNGLCFCTVFVMFFFNVFLSILSLKIYALYRGCYQPHVAGPVDHFSHIFVLWPIPVFSFLICQWDSAQMLACEYLSQAAWCEAEASAVCLCRRFEALRVSKFFIFPHLDDYHRFAVFPFFCLGGLRFGPFFGFHALGLEFNWRLD